MKKYLKTKPHILILQQIPFKPFIKMTGARVRVGARSVKFIYQDYVLVINQQEEPKSDKYLVALYRKTKSNMDTTYRQVRRLEGGTLLELPTMMSKVSGLTVEHFT